MALRDTISRHPGALRVAPFVVLVVMTTFQGADGAGSAYWVYLLKMLVGAVMVLALRPLVAEMRWAFSWEAVMVGIGIFVAWVGISGEWTTQNQLWIKFGLTHPPKAAPSIWNPQAQFGGCTPLAWFLMSVHIVGMTLVVPPLEEIFYRSFLYRYLAKHDFLSVPMNRFLPLPFIATVAVFGLAHNEWLAAILCGAAYQWLVLRKNRLGDAMTAHAITNFLLGVWVVWRGAWHFW